MRPKKYSLRTRAKSRKTSRTDKKTPKTSSADKNSSSTSSTGQDKKISAYDRDCERYLRDHGLYTYPENYEKSEMLEAINESLKESRPSLSPPQFTAKHFETFRRTSDRAIGEAKITSTILPMMAGSNIDFEQDIVFNNLSPLIDGSPGLVDAKPDFYDGADPESLDPDVRNNKELAQYIVPSKQHHAPMLPNFSVEVKGPDGSPGVARRQAAIAAHLGTRAMDKIRSYGTGSDVHDGKARSFACTLVDGQLKAYGSYSVKSPSSKRDTDYRMSQMRAFSLTDKPETQREGITYFRNLRERAKKERDEAIELANARVARARTENAEPEAQSISIDDDHTLNERSRYREQSGTSSRERRGEPASQTLREGQRGQLNSRHSSRIAKMISNAEMRIDGPSNSKAVQQPGHRNRDYDHDTPDNDLSAPSLTSSTILNRLLSNPPYTS